MDEDFKNLASEIAVSVLSESIKHGGKIAKSAKEKLKINLKIGFSRYLEKIEQRCSKTKTLLYSDHSVDLTEIYVNSSLRHHDKVFSDVSVAEMLAKTDSKIVISGTAGSGKSMMMRFIALHLIKTKGSRIPVFFELRNINKNKKIDLIEHLYSQFDLDTDLLSFEMFCYGIEQGIFAFILDGFDELDEDVSDGIEKDLRLLYEKHNNNTFAVSSRPDNKLNASVLLDVYHVKPLSKKSTIKLISKLRYEKELQDSFIERVDKELYDKHTDFLSSPLLATMMLLTYNQFQNIPSKIHVFYGQVYEVLYSRHDRVKGGFYRREFKTKLAMDDFSSIFQAFCLFSYLSSTLQFSQEEALNFINASIDHVGLRVNKEEFLTDLLKAVCFLIWDGNKITFAHRSFQEYFTALYLKNSEDKDFSEILEHIESRIEQDTVFELLFGMQKDRLERNFILSKVRSFQENTDGLKEHEIAIHTFNYLFDNAVFYPQVGFLENAGLEDEIDSVYERSDIGELGLRASDNYKLFRFMVIHYPEMFDCVIQSNDRVAAESQGYFFKFPELILACSPISDKSLLDDLRYQPSKPRKGKKVSKHKLKGEVELLDQDIPKGATDAEIYDITRPNRHREPIDEYEENIASSDLNDETKYYNFHDIQSQMRLREDLVELFFDVFASIAAFDSKIDVGNIVKRKSWRSFAKKNPRLIQ